MDRTSIGLARHARRLEADSRLDGAVAALDAVTPAAPREGPLRSALGGTWLGHSLHPALPDHPRQEHA